MRSWPAFAFILVARRQHHDSTVILLLCRELCAKRPVSELYSRHCSIAGRAGGGRAERAGARVRGLGRH